jgi:hypothetical protein
MSEDTEDNKTEEENTPDMILALALNPPWPAPWPETGWYIRAPVGEVIITEGQMK